MSEFDSRDSEICQNTTSFLENNLVTNIIIKTTFNNGPLRWKFLTLDKGKTTLDYYYYQHYVIMSQG